MSEVKIENTDPLRSFYMIGAGKVARQLSLSLKDSGLMPQGVYSPHLSHACILATDLGTTATCFLRSVPALFPVYIIAVSDDAIPEVTGELCPRISQANPSAVFIHTSGSTPMSVLSGLAQHFGVMYPLFSFVYNKRQDLSQVPFFTESSDAFADETIKYIVEGISQCPATYMDSETRKKMHLAAVFASNFSNRCFAIAEKLMNDAGVPFQRLLPLIFETTERLATMLPSDSQTGPAVRNDRKIIHSHEQMLSGEDRKIYELMSRSIYKASKEKNDSK